MKISRWGTPYNGLYEEAAPEGVIFSGFRYMKGRGAFHQLKYRAISRKVVGKNVQATIPKGNMGYDQYTVPNTAAVEPTFVAFL